MDINNLREYIEIGNEIEFTFNKKKYSITYFYPEEIIDGKLISFCEFYRNTTEVKTADELWNDVSRDGYTVGEMLSSISENDIEIF